LVDQVSRAEFSELLGNSLSADFDWERENVMCIRSNRGCGLLQLVDIDRDCNTRTVGANRKILEDVRAWTGGTTNKTARAPPPCGGLPSVCYLDHTPLRLVQGTCFKYQALMGAIVMVNQLHRQILEEWMRWPGCQSFQREQALHTVHIEQRSSTTEGKSFHRIYIKLISHSETVY
jgi:hypothetical protein